MQGVITSIYVVADCTNIQKYSMRGAIISIFGLGVECCLVIDAKFLLSWPADSRVEALLEQYIGGTIEDENKFSHTVKGQYL